MNSNDPLIHTSKEELIKRLETLMGATPEGVLIHEEGTIVEVDEAFTAIIWSSFITDLYMDFPITSFGS